ncbi:sigma factor [Streptomyces sp. NPDC059209]|uniref:sigma factor n=1 Tax=Streptomyces sp. NPDC059209 TaxID=3346769 RepID=UPI0036AAE95F
MDPGDRDRDPDRDGDFEAFVAARGPRLLRVAWLLTGDAHLAEDLLQMTLAKVWPKWPDPIAAWTWASTSVSVPPGRLPNPRSSTTYAP